MNVAELIRELEQLPRHAPVRLRLNSVRKPSTDCYFDGYPSFPLSADDEEELDYVRYEGNYVLLRP